MKILLLTDGSGTEMQAFAHSDETTKIKIYTDVDGLVTEESFNLDEQDLDDLILELLKIQRLHKNK